MEIGLTPHLKFNTPVDKFNRETSTHSKQLQPIWFETLLARGLLIQSKGFITLLGISKTYKSIHRRQQPTIVTLTSFDVSPQDETYKYSVTGGTLESNEHIFHFMNHFLKKFPKTYYNLAVAMRVFSNKSVAKWWVQRIQTNHQWLYWWKWLHKPIVSFSILEKPSTINTRTRARIKR